jgi:hypothetical protein
MDPSEHEAPNSTPFPISSLFSTHHTVVIIIIMSYEVYSWFTYERSELNYVFGLEKVDRWNPIRTSAIQSRSRPMRFLGFSNHEKEVPRQEISK